MTNILKKVFTLNLGRSPNVWLVMSCDYFLNVTIGYCVCVHACRICFLHFVSVSNDTEWWSILWCQIITGWSSTGRDCDSSPAQSSHLNWIKVLTAQHLIFSSESSALLHMNITDIIHTVLLVKRNTWDQYSQWATYQWAWRTRSPYIWGTGQMAWGLGRIQFINVSVQNVCNSSEE